MSVFELKLRFLIRLTVLFQCGGIHISISMASGRVYRSVRQPEEQESVLYRDAHG